jgi:hypothetical protein
MSGTGTAFVTIGTETSGHAVHATLCTLVASQAASPAWAAHGAVLLSADAVAFFAARLSSSNPFGGTASAASSVTIPIPRTGVESTANAAHSTLCALVMMQAATRSVTLAGAAARSLWAGTGW